MCWNSVPGRSIAQHLPQLLTPGDTDGHGQLNHQVFQVLRAAPLQALHRLGNLQRIACGMPRGLCPLR